MNKCISRLLLFVMLMTSVIAFTACGSTADKPIESNWKFDSLKSGTKTTKAADIGVDDAPMIIIDKDNLNQGCYFVTYRQSGKNHNASMQQQSDGSYRINYVDSDKDMIAKVKGDKLTLTVDGNNELSVVFKCTDEQILIPVNEKIGPDYIKAKMVDKDKVEITNEGNAEYMYGKFYQLEVQKNGKWCYARVLQHFAYTGIGIMLPAGDTHTEEYDLSFYGTLNPGEYRIALGDLDACIYAYFTVSADGSYSFAK